MPGPQQTVRLRAIYEIPIFSTVSPAEVGTAYQTACETGFRNGPLGVKPPSDDLATVIVLPFVVDTRVATSCHQMGAGEPI